MVVDDDRAVLRSLKRILEADAYEVICCASAQGALDSIAARPPDAILLDLMMPEMNGRQFLEKLRDDIGMGHIPVLVITGVRGLDVGSALSMGASDVIEKPFDVDQLLNKIALVMFRAHRAQNATADAAASIPKPTRRTGEFSVLILHETIVLISADEQLTEQVESVLASNSRRVVPLVRASGELPRVVRALKPRAMFIDMDVPGTGAMKALRQLREQRELDGVPMMLIARELEQPDVVRDELESLAVGLMMRPCSDQDILSFVANPPPSASSGDR